MKAIFSDLDHLIIILTPSFSPGSQVSASFKQCFLLSTLNMFYDLQPVNLAYDFTIPSCITGHRCSAPLHWSFGTNTSPH